MTRFIALIALAVVLVALAGCQGSDSKIPSADELIDKAQQATDRAQTWVDENRDLARRVDRMWRAYESGNMQEAEAELAALRERVNWDEGILASDEIRTRVLEGGTSIYEALDRPDKARALLEDVLPHLDGETRQKWEAALDAYENAGTQTTDPPPAE